MEIRDKNDYWNCPSPTLFCVLRERQSRASGVSVRREKTRKENHLVLGPLFSCVQCAAQAQVTTLFRNFPSPRCGGAGHDSSPWEADTGKSEFEPLWSTWQVLEQPGLHRERPCLKRRLAHKDPRSSSQTSGGYLHKHMTHVYSDTSLMTHVYRDTSIMIRLS